MKAPDITNRGHDSNAALVVYCKIVGEARLRPKGGIQLPTTAQPQ
jgi:hypothetical protein